FEKLVDALQPERSLSHSPLFQVMFALHNAPMTAIELDGLTLSPVEIETRTAKFDITLNAVDMENGLAGSIEYNADLFDEETIKRMSDHFQTLLESIAAHPNQKISQLNLLSDQDRRRLIYDY